MTWRGRRRMESIAVTTLLMGARSEGSSPSGRGSPGPAAGGICDGIRGGTGSASFIGQWYCGLVELENLLQRTKNGFEEISMKCRLSEKFHRQRRRPDERA